MTETSYYWGGITVGDATLAPYDDDEFSDIWRQLFLKDRATMGYIDNVLNELAITVAAPNVSIASGAALVDGKFYLNDAAMLIAIPTPLGATRWDRIVLRKSWAAQTVRLTRIAGAEGGGVAPALVQIDGVTWDVPICRVSITVAAAITLQGDDRIKVQANIGGGADILQVQAFS